MLLGRYLDRDPRRLALELGVHGKPALRGTAGQAHELRFNLSHSGELMLVAVTTGREVGVDIELMRAGRTAELLRAWTVREAAVKCLGVGLGGAPPAADESTELWTEELDVGTGAVAAVAVAGRERCEVRRWRWPA